MLLPWIGRHVSHRPHRAASGAPYVGHTRRHPVRPAATGQSPAELAEVIATTVATVLRAHGVGSAGPTPDGPTAGGMGPPPPPTRGSSTGDGRTVRRAQTRNAVAPPTPPGFISAELAEVIAASIATHPPIPSTTRSTGNGSSARIVGSGHMFAAPTTTGPMLPAEPSSGERHAPAANRICFGSLRSRSSDGLRPR